MKKTLLNIFVKYLRSPWWAKLCVMILLVAFIFGWFFTYTYVGYHREKIAYEKLRMAWPEFSFNQIAQNTNSGDVESLLYNGTFRVNRNVISSVPANGPPLFFPVEPDNLWDRIWHEWKIVKSRVYYFSLGKVDENFHYITHFKQLRHLEIRDEIATLNGELKYLVELKHLTKLIIKVKAISLQDSQTLARLPNLKKLEITVITITPQQRNILESIPNCNLKILP